MHLSYQIRVGRIPTLEEPVKTLICRLYILAYLYKSYIIITEYIFRSYLLPINLAAITDAILSNAIPTVTVTPNPGELPK